MAALVRVRTAQWASSRESGRDSDRRRQVLFTSPDHTSEHRADSDDKSRKREHGEVFSNGCAGRVFPGREPVKPILSRQLRHRSVQILDIRLTKRASLPGVSVATAARDSRVRKPSPLQRRRFPAAGADRPYRTCRLRCGGIRSRTGSMRTSRPSAFISAAT